MFTFAEWESNKYYIAKMDWILEVPSACEWGFQVIEDPGHVEEGDPLEVRVQQVEEEHTCRHAHEQERTHPKERDTMLHTNTYVPTLKKSTKNI
jgi:MOSC domain-containing protein YiiM